MTPFDQSLIWLDQIERAKLRFRSTDVRGFIAILRDLTSWFCSAPVEERELLRGLVTDRAAGNLIALGTSAAIQAMNEGRAELIEAAVVAHVIEDFRRDPRENIRDLALVDCAARMLGLDFSVLVESLIDCAATRAKDELTSYLRRPEELNTPGNFGVALIHKEGIYDFVPVAVPFNRFRLP